jgi:hypothetical protein
VVTTASLLHPSSISTCCRATTKSPSLSKKQKKEQDYTSLKLSQASRLQEKYEKQNYEFFKEDKIAL